MKKFIHVRGSMGSGKTTAVRQYLQKTGGFTLRQVNIQGKNYPFHYNKEKNILVTGFYGRRVCDGCDGIITNKAIMMNYLLKLIDLYSPDYVIFEGVMYGKTTLFARNLSEQLTERGYHYRGIALVPPIEFCYKNIMIRNGGKPIKIGSLNSVWLSAKRSAEKLKEEGFDIEYIDSSKMPMDRMNEIIEMELRV